MESEQIVDDNPSYAPQSLFVGISFAGLSSLLTLARNMKNFLRSIALLWILSPALEAREIPHYRMDSFALLSDAVVLCEEKKIDFVETEYHGGLKTVHCVIMCRIIESFKGDIKVGSDMKIKYDASFARYRIGQNGYMDGSTNPPTLVKPKYVPAGNAVLFLKKSSDGEYSVITAKLIQGAEILEFRQADNPGPLVLYPQKKEGNEATDKKSYDVDEFIKDVRLSIEASRKLKSPIRIGWDSEKTPISQDKEGQQIVAPNGP